MAQRTAGYHLASPSTTTHTHTRARAQVWRQPAHCLIAGVSCMTNTVVSRRELKLTHQSCWVCASSFNKTVSYKLDFFSSSYFLQQAINEHGKQSARTNRQQISDILPEMSAVNSSGTGRIVAVRVLLPRQRWTVRRVKLHMTRKQQRGFRDAEVDALIIYLCPHSSQTRPLLTPALTFIARGWRGVDALMDQRVFTDS